MIITHNNKTYSRYNPEDTIFTIIYEFLTHYYLNAPVYISNDVEDMGYIPPTDNTLLTVGNILEEFHTVNTNQPTLQNILTDLYKVDHIITPVQSFVTTHYDEIITLADFYDLPPRYIGSQFIKEKPFKNLLENTVDIYNTRSTDPQAKQAALAANKLYIDAQYYRFNPLAIIIELTHVSDYPDPLQQSQPSSQHEFPDPDYEHSLAFNIYTLTQPTPSDYHYTLVCKECAAPSVPLNSINATEIAIYFDKEMQDTFKDTYPYNPSSLCEMCPSDPQPATHVLTNNNELINDALYHYPNTLRLR